MKRPTPIKDGQRFGRLRVLSVYHSIPNPIDGRKVRMCRCECECGRTKVVRAQALMSGATTSCGCAQKRAVSKSQPVEA